MAIDIEISIISINVVKENIGILEKKYQEMLKEMNDKIDVELKLYWDGNRYDEFKEELLVYKQTLEVIENLLINEIPRELENIINTYSKSKEQVINYQN